MNKVLLRNQRLRISNLGERLDIPVMAASRLVIQFLALHNNTWSTAVVAVRRSIDSDNIVEFPTAISVSGETIIELDTSACNYVHLVVTTAQSGTSDIAINTMSNSYQSQ
jgi:hypothetical protein